MGMQDEKNEMRGDKEMWRKRETSKDWLETERRKRKKTQEKKNLLSVFCVVIKSETGEKKKSSAV